MKKYDVTALGELLIDFTNFGETKQGNPAFEANPGGAPCNVLAMLKKMSKSCAFIGKVGDDLFGKMLTDIVKEIGIETKGIIKDSYYNTTLAFVQNQENGEREFSFYRHPGADMMLDESEVSYELIKNSKIFHWGTLSMTDEVVRNATKKAIACAKEEGILCSFDPNLREPLWRDLEEAKEQILYGLGQCDIGKISDNELVFITGEEDLQVGARRLREQFPNITLLNVTVGAEGSYSYYKNMEVFYPAYRLGGTIETTGAGDTFCGCVLNYVLEHGLHSLTEENLKEMLSFANAAAYLVTTKKGAIRSMPEKEAVESIIKG